MKGQNVNADSAYWLEEWLKTINQLLFAGYEKGGKVSVYKTSLIKQRRRTRTEIDDIRDALLGVLVKDHPATVRQVFYQLVSMGVIPKTENEYRNTVCRLLAKMRREGIIPFGWISDNTRWMRKPRTYNGLSEVLEITARAYRRSLWTRMPAYVEIWLEKDALAGVLYEVTEKWDVPLMVTRGYPSLSFLYEAAEYLSDIG